VNGVGFCMCVSDVLLASYHHRHRHRQRHNYKHLRCRYPAPSLTRSLAMRAHASLPCPNNNAPTTDQSSRHPPAARFRNSTGQTLRFSTRSINFPMAHGTFFSLCFTSSLVRTDLHRRSWRRCARFVRTLNYLSARSHRHPIRRDCGE
jgi:hypothetical protein